MREAHDQLSAGNLYPVFCRSVLQSIVGYDRRSRGTRAAGQRLVLDAPFIGAHTDRSVARDLDEIDVRTLREPPRIVTDTPAASVYVDADPAYDNFAWFLNAATDALLAAQNLCVEAELKGLGICYLGTTIYTAGEIADILELPKGVIPLTTVVVGYPDESPGLTDRLPLEGVVHYEKYTDYTAAEIDELWAEREESELTKRLLEENDLPNLAQVFTQRRYVRKDNLAISNSYFALLKEKGFFNN